MLNFLSNKIKTYIIYGLFSLLLATGASHIWCSIEKSSLQNDKTTLTNTIDAMRTDIEKAVRAEASCKRGIEKLIKASRKKQKVINNYRTKIDKGVQHEKINNLNDFINYAERLQ